MSDPSKVIVTDPVDVSYVELTVTARRDAPSRSDSATTTRLSVFSEFMRCGLRIKIVNDCPIESVAHSKAHHESHHESANFVIVEAHRTDPPVRAPRFAMRMIVTPKMGIIHTASPAAMAACQPS